jgi:hypothetical protein
MVLPPLSPGPNQFGSKLSSQWEESWQEFNTAAGKLPELS